MLEDLGKCLQREHVQVKKVASLVIDGFLEFLLCWGVGGEIANASGGNVVLSEGVHEALSSFGRIGELCRSGRRFRISGQGISSER